MNALTSSVQRRQVALTQDGLSIGKPGHSKGGLLDFIPLADISVVISLAEGSGEVSGGLSKMPFDVRRNQNAKPTVMGGQHTHENVHSGRS